MLGYNLQVILTLLFLLVKTTTYHKILWRENRLRTVWTRLALEMLTALLTIFAVVSLSRDRYLSGGS